MSVRGGPIVRAAAAAAAVVLALAGCTPLGAQERDGVSSVRSSVVSARVALVQYLDGRSTEPATDTVFGDALTQIGEQRQTLAELTAGTAAQRATLRTRLAAVDRAARTVQDVRGRLAAGAADDRDAERLREAAKRLAGT